MEYITIVMNCKLTNIFLHIYDKYNTRTNYAELG